MDARIKSGHDSGGKGTGGGIAGGPGDGPSPSHDFVVGPSLSLGERVVEAWRGLWPSLSRSWVRGERGRLAGLGESPPTPALPLKGGGSQKLGRTGVPSPLEGEG